MPKKKTLLQSWLQNHSELEAQGRKLAIIAGPGGNAGVISAGSIAALLQTGTLPPNAQYIGTSVGAFNLLYLLANNNPEAATIFGRYYCDNRFINPRRLLLGKPALNIDYVLDEVAEHLVPIDYTTAAGSHFTISALSTDTHGKIALLPLTGTSKSSVQQALRATAAMPYLGRTHKLADLAEWDGWLVEHQLLPYLKQYGITDVVWFLNRPLEEADTRISQLLWRYIRHKFKRQNPTLRQLIKNRTVIGNFLNQPLSMELEVFTPHVNIPANSRNPAQLFHALGTSYRRMAEYLGQPNLPYPAAWQPWQHHMPK